MSEESSQERTEDPTQKRRDDAKEQGKVARSKELNMAIVMMAGSAGVLLFGGDMMRRIAAVATVNFQFTRAEIFEPNLLFKHINDGILQMIYSLLPFFLVVILAALAGPILLSGWSFSIKSLSPKAERLSPLKGLKRIFALRALIELLKTLIKFFVILIAGGLIIYTQLPKFMSLGYGDIMTSLSTSLSILAWSYLGLSATLLLIAGIDIPFQLWEHMQSLKMSKQEIRDEYKESEGRPEVKGHIRHMQREIAKQRMMEEVPKADVIITNPTHYAIALKYEEHGTRAPVVVAKGKDLVALQIRGIANHHEISIIESPKLARAIFYSTKLNHEIPQGLYVAVAQVLAYVYQLKRYKKTGQNKPKELGEVPIPETLLHD